MKNKKKDIKIFVTSIIEFINDLTSEKIININRFDGDDYYEFKINGKSNTLNLFLREDQQFLYSVFCRFNTPTYLSGQNCKFNFHSVITDLIDLNLIIELAKEHINNAVNELK